MSDGTDSSTDITPRRTRYPLERGHVRYKLIHELARGEKTLTKLAEEYGVVHSAIIQFRDRHQTRVNEVKADIENEFAGLWIAEKRARIAEYQADVELINDSGAGQNTKMADADMLRVKAAIMRAVADELGHIPSKVNINVSQKVTYVIEGVDPETLR